ncbi:MAG: FliH/SctL family protein [Bryobacteraceae bacterium]
MEAVRWRPGAKSLESTYPSEAGKDNGQSAQELAELRFLLEASEQRFQAQLAQARQEAFAEGLRQAREEGSAQFRALQDSVGQTLASLAQTKRKLRQEGEVELLKLSLAIARRILHREISIDAEALHGLVHAAMQKLQNREISRARVNPSGVDAVRTALERIGAAPAVEIVSDPTLKAGDIIFETQFGELDASIDSQLAEIQRGFADRLSIR